jgi:asparagine synthase (glutamine-hydrolysing)
MLNKMLELDWKYTLADNDLRKVNLMCELAGIGVQYPMLDDDLVDFSTRVPPEMKIHRFRLRHFFKHAMKDFLPPKILGKSKHGFGLPFGIWMKSYKPLRDLAYDSLTDLKKRNFVQSSYLDELIQSHDSVHAHYYGEFIWVLMMLELWLEKHDNGLDTKGLK